MACFDSYYDTGITNAVAFVSLQNADKYNIQVESLNPRGYSVITSGITITQKNKLGFWINVTTQVNSLLQTNKNCKIKFTVS